jgi:putative flippase GtrA
MSGTVTQSGTRNNTKETTVGYFATGTVMDSEILNNIAGMTRGYSANDSWMFCNRNSNTFRNVENNTVRTASGCSGNTERNIEQHCRNNV